MSIVYSLLTPDEIDMLQKQSAGMSARYYLYAVEHTDGSFTIEKETRTGSKFGPAIERSFTSKRGPFGALSTIYAINQVTGWELAKRQNRPVRLALKSGCFLKNEAAELKETSQAQNDRRAG